MTEKSSFQLYSEELDAAGIVPRSRKELAALHKRMVLGDREAHQILWLHGTKLVLKIVNTFSRKGLLTSTFEDAVAEGNAAIGDALTRWDPRKSSFSTWVWIRIRGAILNENEKDGKSGMVGGPLEDSPWVVAEDSQADLFKATDSGATYPDASLFDDSELVMEQLGPSELAEHGQLYDAINQLPDRERIYVRMFYFDDIPQQDIAVLEGCSQQMVSRVLKRAESRLKELLSGG